MNPTQKKSTLPLVVSLALLSLVSTTAAGQEIKLVNNVSGLEVSGRLVGIDNDRFIVDSDFGRVNVDNTNVTCIGIPCPPIDQSAYDLMFSGTDNLTLNLLPSLFEGYASSLDIGFTNNGPITALKHSNSDVFSHFGSRPASVDESIKQLADGAVDFILTDSTLSRAHNTLVKNANAGDLSSIEREHIVGAVGAAVMLHVENDLSMVTQGQLAAIFAGEITNWNELGHTDAPINVYAIAGDTFENSFIHDLLEKNDQTPVKYRATMDMAGLHNAVMADPSAIAIAAYGDIPNVRWLPVQDECGVARHPTDFHIKAGVHPYVSSVYAYSHLLQNELGRSLSDFLDGPLLDAVVAETWVTDLSIARQERAETMQEVDAVLTRTTDAYEASLLEDMIDDVAEFQRSSIHFRFKRGTTQLDNRSLQDLVRLTNYIVEQNIKSVLLTGHTDNSGGFDSNLRAGEQLTDVVMRSLLQADQDGNLDGVALAAKTYGELFPAACNNNATGRAINRRVEVWLKQ